MNNDTKIFHSIEQSEEELNNNNMSYIPFLNSGSVVSLKVITVRSISLSIT